MLWSESGGRISISGMSSVGFDDDVEVEVGDIGGEGRRYGMKAWEPYCGSGSISSAYNPTVVFRPCGSTR